MYGNNTDTFWLYCDINAAFHILSAYPSLAGTPTKSLAANRRLQNEVYMQYVAVLLSYYATSWCVLSYNDILGPIITIIYWFEIINVQNNVLRFI